MKVKAPVTTDCPRCGEALEIHDSREVAECAYALGYSRNDEGAH